MVEWAYTDYIDANQAANIEKKCHTFFSEKRLKGEFFRVGFQQACQELSKHAEIKIQSSKYESPKIIATSYKKFSLPPQF